MLYWGSQGVERDLNAAVNYYRQAAETRDPVSLYDYAIVLLKVVLKNVACNNISCVLCRDKALRRT